MQKSLYVPQGLYVLQSFVGPFLSDRLANEATVRVNSATCVGLFPEQCCLLRLECEPPIQSLGPERRGKRALILQEI